jgi:hypothetical protein
VPKPSAYYYKKHADHAGFAAPGAGKKGEEERKVDVPVVKVDGDAGIGAGASASTSAAV